MRIIIEGAGEIGSHLAKMLSNESYDITVIDPEVRWTPQEGGFVSRSQNSAFIGHDLIGCACDVFVDGKQILASGALL